MNPRIIISSVTAILSFITVHSFSQTTKTQVINYLNSEFSQRHAVAGWDHTDSDWFIRVNGKDLNGNETWTFYDINGYTLENEYLILKIREQKGYQTQNGRSYKILGTMMELLLDLNDSLLLKKISISKNQYKAHISFKSYELAHRGEEYILDTRYPPNNKTTIVRKNPVYKQNKNYDADKTEELFQKLTILKNGHDSIENANYKLTQFKKELINNILPKEVSEEQRRYVVQANSANEARDYSNAILLYRKALDVNKFSYPNAYFNMALILAQNKSFYQATYAMKAYLIVAPEAEDARKAQDKIYEWELNIKY